MIFANEKKKTSTYVTDSRVKQRMVEELAFRYVYSSDTKEMYVYVTIILTMLILVEDSPADKALGFHCLKRFPLG